MIKWVIQIKEKETNIVKNGIETTESRYLRALSSEEKRKRNG